MCWGVPGKVIKVEGITAIVDFGGAKRKVFLGMDDIKEGDLVMVHAGVIISKVSREELLQSFKYYEDLAVELEVLSGKPEEVARREAQQYLKNLLKE